ncbi:MAG: EamA family transporter, partial [Tissierellia bacterium]|nr:EamA family transporter [Tissierellia bacterium]
PILQSTGYVFVTMTGAVFLGEKITKRKVLGLALILSGVAVFVLG